MLFIFIYANNRQQLTSNWWSDKVSYTLREGHETVSVGQLFHSEQVDDNDRGERKVRAYEEAERRAVGREEGEGREDGNEKGGQSRETDHRDVEVETIAPRTITHVSHNHLEQHHHPYIRYIVRT